MTKNEAAYLTDNSMNFNEISKEAINNSKPPDNEPLCFVDLAEKWLLSEKLKTKESTFVQYNLILRNHIYPLLGNRLVVDIDRQIIEETIFYYLSSGKLDGSGGLATKTTSDILMIIKSIFDYANQTGVLSTLPTKGISVKKRTKELCVLTLSEERALLLYLFNNTDLYKLGVLICLYTGIRILKKNEIIFSDTLGVCQVTEVSNLTTKKGDSLCTVTLIPKLFVGLIPC